jgi:excisionase family DNA binding protein
MALMSVAEAAQRLGVGVPRIHQRIADGSLRAERIGSQWAVDELSLLQVAERRSPGRPLSPRSAWALIALSVGDVAALADLAPSERSRAAARLAELFGAARRVPRSEREVRRGAAMLRQRFRNRADRVLLKAADADLAGLRADGRWESVLSPAVSGIASGEVEGYLVNEHFKPLSDDFLLVPADRDANVIAHVLPAGQRSYPDSLLLLAADLSEHRGPREERRAVELLREIADAARSGKS